MSFTTVRTTLSTLLLHGRVLTWSPAWKVDFNLALPSFEGDLQSVRNLVDLCLSSGHATPPKIVFISSIGIFGSKSSPVVGLRQSLLTSNLAQNVLYILPSPRSP